MSWSRTYTGDKHEVLERAQADIAEIEGTLPEFEQGDVAAVVDAAESALVAVDPAAKVTLSISGHGHRATDGTGAGTLSVSISYTIAKEAAE